MAASPETTAFIVFLLIPLMSINASAEDQQAVTYDGRSLMINGRRMLFFSGSIHYPRSTPEMWPNIIAKAKKGGLNMIQTYVFWNVHEPEEGKFNFEGRYDLVRFIKEIQKQGLYVTLRIGPFIEAEWNFGGFPFWLREVANISFRTENPPFQFHMQKWVSKIVDMMKDEKLFAPQGGPIILSQIENEYNNVARAYKDAGRRYVQWAGIMAEGLNTGVPWIMCKEDMAPGKVISACNGRNCADTFKRPDSPTKPFLWAENWTAQYRVFGDPPSQRAAEDLAYSVARFFSRNGTSVNYYMYHGGTNFGRTGSSFVTTRYYDEAPLDEFGLYKEPKYGHLSDLHQALQLCSKPLLFGVSSIQDLGGPFDAVVYENTDMKVCVAFLSNSDRRKDGTVKFRGREYYLPRRSISILQDCKNVAFNTKKVHAQHNTRTFDVAKQADMNNQWKMYTEPLPRRHKTSIIADKVLEHYNITRDKSDYLWYTTSFTLEKDALPVRKDIHPVLLVSNLGHAMHAFSNKRYVGSAHGTNIEKSFIFQKPIVLNEGVNHITLLGVTTGLPDSGSYLEVRIAGVHTVVIQGLNTGSLDLSYYKWGHKTGLRGERLGIFTEEGAKKFKWRNAKAYKPATWYKRYFDCPSGNEPVALEMSSMGKGMLFVNGESIGRYWVSYHNPLGKPTQPVYHVPRSLLKPKNNVLMLFEEEGGKPEDILVVTVKRDDICAFVSELYPWQALFGQVQESIKSSTKDSRQETQLKCEGKKVIQSIEFASFGNPFGLCGNLTRGSCHAPDAKKIVEKACLGKKMCVLPISYEAYGADINCPGTTATLAVHAKCSLRGHEKSKA